VFKGRLTIEFLFEHLGTDTFTNLTTVILTQCDLQSLEHFENTEDFIQLETLDISKNLLSHIDPVFKFKKLKSLNASYNSIQLLHSGDLSMKKSQIEQDGLPNLTELKLSFNYIESLPFLYLERFPKLRTLDLSGNRLKEVR
jgi:Leucine-rich repeat (LRR) protein